MRRTGLCIFDAALWCFVVYLLGHMPTIEMRVDELEQAAQKYRSPEPVPASTPAPIYPKPNMKLGKCFHLDRSQCPTKELRCDTVDPTSVFCCDVDSFTLKEGLTAYMKQNITNLHVLNATITELDLSQSVFRRLASMALTDGNIGQIVGQFPKHSSIACLNISNNNLTTAKLPTTLRPFAYLFNLTVLDASANNLTEFPLSLVQSNRKIFIDMSGNNHMPCKEFQMAMDSNNSLVTFLNYNKTYCVRDIRFNDRQWFQEKSFLQIDHLKVQKELTNICRNIKPLDANCTCFLDRLELMHLEYMVTVDCTQRHLKVMPTDLPPNTWKLNVSYNNVSCSFKLHFLETGTHLEYMVTVDCTQRHLKVMPTDLPPNTWKLNVSYNNVSCSFKLHFLETGTHLEYMVTVDCTQRHLKVMPTDLPPNTWKLNVSYNNITSLEAVGDDPSYELLKILIADHNDIENIGPLEGTNFADNFMLFSITHNKLKNIHTYMLSNMFDNPGSYNTFLIGGNYIHCDCNTEKVIKPWLIEVSKTILDYKELYCEDNMGPVVELKEFQVCHTPRDWTDYIYYIITLEVLILVLLISKVSYDYWIFKTAGYLPWPANKMPRLPCDWLCE
ncbi:protein halfway isoform X1 [Cydia splendana]|uniref:protein halfway isoform X1 n=1 Tax=Cydia splendana TaxID=1100963 RepID=UPI00300C53A7